RIRWLVEHNTPVLGICGGYQMLGRRVCDPLQLESEQTYADGLRLFSFDTEIASQKRLSRTSGRIRNALPGIWNSLGGSEVQGYEIHAGQSDPGPEIPLLDIGQKTDGGVTADGRVAGTYVHGCFELPETRRR